MILAGYFIIIGLRTQYRFIKIFCDADILQDKLFFIFCILYAAFFIQQEDLLLFLIKTVKRSIVGGRSAVGYFTLYEHQNNSEYCDS